METHKIIYPLLTPQRRIRKHSPLFQGNHKILYDLGELIDGKYFTAFGNGDVEFKYELNGKKWLDMEFVPCFYPMDINMTARLFRDQVESNANNCEDDRIKK